MTHDGWQFWIDVGGTFTDCIGRTPDGHLVRRKVLSSGITKGNVGRKLSPTDWTDSRLGAYPDSFWNGCEVRFLNSKGEVSGTTRIVAFRPQKDVDSPNGSERLTGHLSIDQDTASSLTSSIAEGDQYEIVSPFLAPVLAIHELLQLPINDALPPVHIRLGTTRGTNALLTRQGARTAFVTTRGFGDILKIGYQNRPRLFDLNIRKPVPLFEAIVEIDERVTASGDVLVPLQLDAVRRSLRTVRAAGIQSLAICFINAYCQPRHEQLVANVARELGFDEVRTSSEVSPLIKLVSRGDTTVVDAYLNPVLRDYIDQLKHQMNGSTLRLLTSAGGLVDATKFSGKDSILSGPAGGVVGFSRVALAVGRERSIGFDMGGTSTDVSRFDGRYEYEYETEKAGVRVVAPMLAIETVAAGGGSICRFDGVKLTVGPESAGSHPGPACYGRGGPLTVTDLNLHLGRLQADHFPFLLDRKIVDERLGEIAAQVERQTGQRLSSTALAAGFLRIANANMARAIHSISVAQGYDPREYTLVAFGGAAPQHACGVADELGMKEILIHPHASLLSAYGIGLANVTRHHVAGIYRPLERSLLSSLSETIDKLKDASFRELLDEGVDTNVVEFSVTLELRYRGIDAPLSVPINGMNVGTTTNSPTESFVERVRTEFERAHRRLYGYVHSSKTLELATVRVEAVAPSSVPLPRSEIAAPVASSPSSTSTVWSKDRWMTVPAFPYAKLTSGSTIKGPALIVDEFSTTMVEEGWRADRMSGGELLLTRTALENIESLESSEQTRAEQADPVQLEIFNHKFAGIAERMGLTLQRTASSVNVKERLDFSCALFTANGDLVVNAPHIPVHLGAMGETVKQLLFQYPILLPGEVFVTNDPFRGGSHLPDVTVITPVHDPVTKQLLFITANRAHHAEIGGITPGSMPPFSTTLAEEGVLIQNFRLVSTDSTPSANEVATPHYDELRMLLAGGLWPSRDPDMNLADIEAQVAANQQGALALLQLVSQRGTSTVLQYMKFIQDAAERKMRQALQQIPPGEYRFVDHLDDGSPVAVCVSIDGDSATIDFTGTGPTLANNLNANRAIVSSAVLYCLRCLIDEDIPLNQGVLTPVRIVLPECLLNPRPGPTTETTPAVVGGNVETSQRVVDVIFGALELAAASQGTMNNLLFGDSTFGYYETICGGAGATRNADGADAVHTHMTNTRLTDPEILEQRFPVRVREFSIRRGSGGKGEYRGGDGVIRRLEFLKPLQVSLLTQRRGRYSPFGLRGGGNGAIGQNRLIRTSGTIEDVGGRAQFSVDAGDLLIVETPGGGAWSQCDEQQAE